MSFFVSYYSLCFIVYFVLCKYIYPKFLLISTCMETFPIPSLSVCAVSVDLKRVSFMGLVLVSIQPFYVFWLEHLIYLNLE